MKSPRSAGTDWHLFRQMAGTFPVRTLIFSFGLPIFGLLQVVNGYLNQGNMGLILLFAVLAASVSVFLTRYQLAIYNRRLLTGQIQSAPKKR
jgi:hypothetical protein